MYDREFSHKNTFPAGFLEFIDFPGAMTGPENLQKMRDNSQDALSLAIRYNLNRDVVLPGFSGNIRGREAPTRAFSVDLSTTRFSARLSRTNPDIAVLA